jgi:hypothetical protein
MQMNCFLYTRSSQCFVSAISLVIDHATISKPQNSFLSRWRYEVGSKNSGLVSVAICSLLHQNNRNHKNTPRKHAVQNRRRPEFSHHPRLSAPGHPPRSPTPPPPNNSAKHHLSSACPLQSTVISYLSALNLSRSTSKSMLSRNALHSCMDLGNPNAMIANSAWVRLVPNRTCICSSV